MTMTDSRPVNTDWRYSAHPYRYHLARAWREVGKPTSLLRLYVYSFTVFALVYLAWSTR